MMKTFIIILILILSARSIPAQTQDISIDSLRHEIDISRNDTLLLAQFTRASVYYLNYRSDSCYYFAEKGLQLARQLDLKLDQAISLGHMSYSLMNLGNHPKSLQTLLSAFRIAEDPASEKILLPLKYMELEGFYGTDKPPHRTRIYILSWLHLILGILYENTNNYDRALSELRLSKQLAAESRNIRVLEDDYYIIGRIFLTLNKLDSALIYEERVIEMTRASGFREQNTLNLGRVYKAMGNIPLARQNFRNALQFAENQKYHRGIVAANLELSGICLKEGNIDSSFYFAKTGFDVAQQMRVPDLLLRSYKALGEVYKSLGKNDSVVKYQALIIKMNDSIFNSKQAKQFQNIEFVERQRQQEMEAAQKAYRNRVLTYSLIAGLVVFVVTALVLFRNNRHKQEAYSLLTRQKRETDIQKKKVEDALEELKSTQIQLIQREKMASMGELTAGIAHEIQNPLNFVNNFSEINKDLLVELREELKNGHVADADILARNIEENEAKIIHHGQRADAIVKSMLEHSHTSSGVKELTDINALTNEYVRLAYHGMCAKDRNFHSKFYTNLDPLAGKIKTVPGEIGRVLLNLVNNAFYTVQEKLKTNEHGYEPLVHVSTRKNDKNIEITVSDNGKGMSELIQQKIFQPFFTTKPAGQGTGLGLSLSYDIVKSQGGEIRVESKEGEGSAFTIVLPC